MQPLLARPWTCSTAFAASAPASLTSDTCFTNNSWHQLTCHNNNSWRQLTCHNNTWQNNNLSLVEDMHKFPRGQVRYLHLPLSYPPLIFTRVQAGAGWPPLLTVTWITNRQQLQLLDTYKITKALCKVKSWIYCKIS